MAKAAASSSIERELKFRTEGLGDSVLVVGDTAIEKRAACRAGNAGESAAAAAAAGAK